MKRFQNYYENNVLEESLNTPLEFYMTDDTKMPYEIYAAFDIDGTQYGMSLILSKYSKVYILDMYRIVNVKKRSWSFIKQQHIRKALSTVIKFMESSYPFLQSKLDGIIIDIPGKTGSEKYVSFLGRVLKRSYIKKFREVPVLKTSSKARNYLFLVKKGINPTSLFTTATFHKNFKFDQGEATFDDVIMDQTTDPYKAVKKTLSLNPSKKYAFGSVKVELSADDDTVDMLDKATELYKINKDNPPPKEKVEEKEYTIIVRDDITTQILSSGVGGVGYGDNTLDKILALALPHVMALILPSAFDKIKTYGYDQSKLIIDDLSYAASEGFKGLPDKLKEELINTGIFKGSISNGNLDTSADNVEKLKGSLAAFMYIEKSDVNKLKTIINEKVGSIKPVTAKKVVGVKEYKLDLEKQPVSVLDSFSSANDSSPYNGYMGFIEVNENVTSKRSEVIKMPEVSKWYNSFDQYSKEGSALYAYTGTAASSMNTSMRSMINSKKLDWSSIEYDHTRNQILTLAEHFKKAPRLSNGIWVYRNADTPGVKNYEVGDDYIDAAFLSTTIKSTMDLSSGGNLRLKIYVPKGTKCLPILGKSGLPHEEEIVLPPMSVLRITELYDGIKNPNHRMMVCTMIGSAFEDMLELGGKGILLEKKVPPKKKDYNPEDKWADSTSSYNDSLEIKKLILKGSLNIKK